MAPVKIRRDEYEEKYYIPKQWMYGQIIGKKGRTLEHIKVNSGCHHVYMDINNGYCLLVGDHKAIKRGKEVINELLNLAAPSTTDTAAAQPVKGTVKVKLTPKTKKLPPLPSEPKPVGRVSRFSLLVNTDDDEEEEEDDEDEFEEISDEIKQQPISSPAKVDPKPVPNNNNDSSILSALHFPTVSKITKESPLSRLVPATAPVKKKSKKKSRKNSEKEQKKPALPPAPPVSTSCSSLSTQASESTMVTSTSTSSEKDQPNQLDVDYLKTAQSLQLGHEFRKSLEHFTNLAEGDFPSTLDYSLSHSISDGLAGAGEHHHPGEKSFDHDLYNNVLSSDIYSSLSSLTGRLISGLKVLETPPDTTSETPTPDNTAAEDDQELPQQDENNNEKIVDKKSSTTSKENAKEAVVDDENEDDEKCKALQEQVKRLNDENLFLRDQLKLYRTCRICKELLEWNEQRVALSCGHIFCSACANQFWKERRCRVCEQRPSGFSYIAMFT